MTRSWTASACTRSRRPRRKARNVNSPGSASRAPAEVAAATICLRITGLPCPLISMTSSPVYERGPGKYVASTRSRGAASSRIHSVGQRRAPRLQTRRRGENPARDGDCACPAHSDDADAPRTRWRRDGDDRVVGDEHPRPRPAAPCVKGGPRECANGLANARTRRPRSPQPEAVMSTVFMKASPTLSDDTPDMSATAR